jgi:hypothetical protein
MVFPPGITSSGMRNPSKEWDSIRNIQLMEVNSDRQDQNAQKILKTVKFQDQQLLYTTKVNLKKI